MNRSRAWRIFGLVVVAVSLLVVTAGVAYAQATRALTVTMTEWSLTPSTTVIPAGTTVTFTAVNTGQFPHALQIVGQGLDTRNDNVAPGTQGTLTVTFTRTGTYEFFCPVGNGSHRQRGMDGAITVVAAAGVTRLPATGGGPVGLLLSPAALAALGGAIALGAGIALRRRHR